MMGCVLNGLMLYTDLLLKYQLVQLGKVANVWAKMILIMNDKQHKMYFILYQGFCVWDFREAKHTTQLYS